MAVSEDFREKRWLALVLLCSAQFVVVLDASIVNVALPTIGDALDFSQFIVVGLTWFSRVSVGGGFTTDILGPSLFAAAGLGFAFVTTTIAAVSGVEESEAGLASGLINTSQQIGGALGLAVLSTIATSRTENLTPNGGPPSLGALADGFQVAFLGGAAIAALGFVLTLVLISNRDSRAHVELGTEAAGEKSGEAATEAASA